MFGFGTKKAAAAEPKAEAPAAAPAAAGKEAEGSPAKASSAAAPAAAPAAPAPPPAKAEAGAPAAEATASSAEVRPEVKATVAKLSVEAAKAAAQPKTKAPPPEVAKEAVKKDKPKAASTAPAAQIPVMPAQVPSPSVFGVAASPATTTSSTTQELAPGAEATYRQRPAAAATQAAEPVPRIQAAQAVGAAPGGGEASKVAAAAAKAGAARAVPAPPRAVEVVSRAPVKADISMPPSATPVPAAVASVGPAAALTALAQPALKAASPAQAPPATTSAAPAAASKSGPPVVPKSGPPALAVGRAVARGAYPAVSMKDGKPVTPIAKKYQIVCVSSEAAPWSKTGGLGEAMDGLPIALAALGHRVMTIAPRYDQYAEAWDTSYWSQVSMGSNTEPVHAFHAYQSKVDRVFLDHDCFLAKVSAKTGSMLYGPDWGQDFADNQWRFTYFAKAALKIVEELPFDGYPYGTNCIIIVNDWHSSLLPVYLAQAKKEDPEKWAATKSAMLIHNAVFQGRFDRDDPEEPSTEIYGLPESVLSTFTFNMPIKVGRTEPKVKRCLNWMAAGALYVDRLLTVSPTYAWELLNLPEMGVELDDIFSSKGITGIVNGIKEGINPMNEAFVKKATMLSTFSMEDVDEKKAALKKYLQELYGLPVSKESALCIFVGRMDLQKGYDYLLAALSAVLEDLDLQLIIVGTGRSDLVASSKVLAKKHPEKLYLAGWCGPERYAIVAGADFNLMPSRWEPCGLAQMESMRFGTLPVVAQTGGLVDTVENMVTGIHLGGAVSAEKELEPNSVELMAQALERCAEVYADRELTSRMRKAAMVAGSEFTWANSALQYEAVCEEMGAVDVLPFCASNTVTLETDRVVA